MFSAKKQKSKYQSAILEAKLQKEIKEKYFDIKPKKKATDDSTAKKESENILSIMKQDFKIRNQNILNLNNLNLKNNLEAQSVPQNSNS